jgi:hypothetical protein
MGRWESYGDDRGYSGRMYLQRVYLNSGGYDSGGAYWGVGQPLFGYESAEDGGDDLIQGFIRADDREHAKEQLRAKFPAVKFFR